MVKNIYSAFPPHLKKKPFEIGHNLGEIYLEKRNLFKNLSHCQHFFVTIL